VLRAHARALRLTKPKRGAHLFELAGEAPGPQPGTQAEDVRSMSICWGRLPVPMPSLLTSKLDVLAGTHSAALLQDSPPYPCATAI